MKKLALILSILFLGMIAFAQDVVVSFTGVNANGGYKRLDSVAIHNYSQGWDRTAIYPDTIMVAILNGINGPVADAEMLSCAPNPFDGETDFVVNFPQAGAVSIKVFDVSGRMFAEYNGKAMEGANMFGVSLLQPDAYLLSVTANGTTSTIKLMNIGSGNVDRIWCKGTMASEKIVVSGDFNLNDVMRYTGYTTYNGVSYTSTPVTKVQTGSENISLEFDIVDCSTPSLTEISVERCVAYTLGGETYTESGDYVQTLHDVNGCDSVVLLHLTITNNGVPVYSEVEINTCADPFVYNGETFTESGSYQQTLTSVTGCDSLVILRLHLGSGVYDERDGNSYCSIMIGEQEWLAENMRYLPSVNNLTDASVVNAKYYVYDYDGTDLNEAINNPNYSDYGVLYNWKAALTACPSGWHLPSDAEWSQLEVYLQNSGYNFDGYIDTDNDRATHNVIAKSLSSTSGWVDSEIVNAPGWLQPKNNTSGFNGKPAGIRFQDSFRELGTYTWWWSSTIKTDGTDVAWNRKLEYIYDGMKKTYNHMSVSFSVRCVRD